MLPYRSWHKIRNNGDTITACIIDKVFDAEPVQVKAEQPHVVAIGSTFFLANSRSTIWGTGVLNKQAYLPDLHPRQIRAVRGRITADQLVAAGIRLEDIPFGDPGLLVNRLVEPTSGSGKPIAVVPHHDSIHHPFFKGVSKREDVCMVDMLDNSLRPVEQIAAADVVISQSLHGLVYATALGKPCLWISDQSNDIWNFKFLDWYSTIGNGQRAPCRISEQLDDMVRCAELQESTVSVEQLISAFPSEMMRPAPDRLMSYRHCRQHDHVMIHLDYDIPEGENAGLGAILNALHHAHQKVFQHWAEPAYAIVVLNGTDTLPTPEQAQAITRKMDEVSYVSYATIVKNDDLVCAAEGIRQLTAGVRFAKQPVKNNRVFVLRPSFPEHDAESLTFAVSQ